MSRPTSALAAAVLVTCTALSANASLIGDSIEGTLYTLDDDGFVTVTFGPAQLVGAGQEFVGEWQWFGGALEIFTFNVDVSESTVTVNVVSSDTDSNLSTSGNGLVGLSLTDLDWVDDPDAVITGLTVTSGNPDVFEMLTFGDHSIMIEWDSLGVFDDNETLESWTFAITTSGHSDPVVPEPATLTLLGIGLTGVLYRSRRRTQ
jgi:hypothetical protein